MREYRQLHEWNNNTKLNKLIKVIRIWITLLIANSLDLIIRQPTDSESLVFLDYLRNCCYCSCSVTMSGCHRDFALYAVMILKSIFNKKIPFICDSLSGGRWSMIGRLFPRRWLFQSVADWSFVDFANNGSSFRRASLFLGSGFRDE
jgi:hypothetical protein